MCFLWDNVTYNYSAMTIDTLLDSVHHVPSMTYWHAVALMTISGMYSLKAYEHATNGKYSFYSKVYQH
jgi:S-adenosylmethionine:tRNA-ribosyltransferase-isomerase (queuine synthetase)